MSLVTLTTVDGQVHRVADLPSGSLDSEDVADEMRRACQRAYEMGRRHQAELLQRKWQDALKASQP